MRKAMFVILVSISLLFCGAFITSAQDDSDYSDDSPVYAAPDPNCELLSAEKRSLTTADFALLKTVLQYGSDPLKTSYQGKTAWLVSPKRFAEAFASSSLPNDKYGAYSPDMARDGEVKTAWVEGAKGSGIGEWLAFCADIEGEVIIVYPGYGTETWKQNNRIKETRIRVFTYGKADGSGAIKPIKLMGETIDMKVRFNDIEDYAYIDKELKLDSGDRCIFVFEILSVYKGSKYDDSCVAEISPTYMQ